MFSHLLIIDFTNFADNKREEIRRDYENNVYIDDNGSLIIRNVSRNDISTEYICVIGNDINPDLASNVTLKLRSTFNSVTCIERALKYKNMLTQIYLEAL